MILLLYWATLLGIGGSAIAGVALLSSAQVTVGTEASAVGGYAHASSAVAGYD